jgi:2-polyprenyl-3-methyl-5-hydroxy-6-metoxy-1,4-benzoquinol methylase/glycosyltransferase involved in cell wall biosynthesis
LTYTSRPERGLENLVAVDGIMDRLQKEGNKAHLFVACYDNVTEQMRGYYEYLFGRCMELENVTLLGNLTKEQLADLQKMASLHVYPTAFEETSCITAMECAAAGLPVLTTRQGNLATYEEYHDGMFFVDNIPNDENYHGKEIRMDAKVDIEAFTAKLLELLKGETLADAVTKQRALVDAYHVNHTADAIEKAIDSTEERYSSDDTSKGALHWSDIQMYKDDEKNEGNAVNQNQFDEFTECYDFYINDKFGDHYAKYYEYEKNRGVNYGPEDLSHNDRFNVVANAIAMELDSLGITEGIILDYGCAHGHYTVNLAKRFPKCRFIGVDIESTNIEKAEQWAKDDGIENVEFFCGYVDESQGGIVSALDEQTITVSNDNDIRTLYKGDTIKPYNVDIVIAAEVLEHVAEPEKVLNTLRKYVKDSALVITTLPQGPWEAEGYEQHWPWRAHIYHMEKADLKAMIGHFREFTTTYIPNGFNKFGEPLGNMVATFRNDSENEVKEVPHNKLSYATQTLSLCMIVTDAEYTLGRCLNSIRNVVDEVVIGFDENCNQATKDVVEQFKQSVHFPVVTFDIDSPMKTGFAEARNKTVDKASGSWIMWLDADEFITDGDRIKKYLRNNMYNAYAIKQHHFSTEPLGLLKTDLPFRLFRNHQGIKFYGYVHEHPEEEYNKSIATATCPPDVDIFHASYLHEGIRMGRFGRNIDLMVKDREKNPDRILGKFLWVRDLVQMAGWEIQQSGGRIPESAYDKAREAADLYAAMIDDETVPERMLVDGLEYYDKAAIMLNGFPFQTVVNGVEVQGHFVDKSHAERLTERLVKQTLNETAPSGKYG